MNKIIIGFSKPKKFKPFAAAIMLGYGTPYDHVYIKFNSSFFSRELIYQASKTLVNFMGTGVFNDENLIVREYQLSISDHQMKDLIQFCIDNVGKPYSMKEALGLGLVRLCELFGKKIRNPFRGSNDTYVCSVLASYVLQFFTDNKLEKDFQDMSPKDVWNHLERIKATT